MGFTNKQLKKKLNAVLKSGAIVRQLTVSMCCFFLEINEINL